MKSIIATQPAADEKAGYEEIDLVEPASGGTDTIFTRRYPEFFEAEEVLLPFDNP